MYDKIYQFVKDNSLICVLVGVVLLLAYLGQWYGKSYRCPAYNQAREQLAEVESQRQRVEAGIKESQSRVDSLSGRLEETQLRVERIEDNYGSAGDIFTDCEQVITELKRRAEKRAASK